MLHLVAIILYKACIICCFAALRSSYSLLSIAVYFGRLNPYSCTPRKAVVHRGGGGVVGGGTRKLYCRQMIDGEGQAIEYDQGEKQYVIRY